MGVRRGRARGGQPECCQDGPVGVDVEKGGGGRRHPAVVRDEVGAVPGAGRSRRGRTSSIFRDDPVLARAAPDAPTGEADTATAAATGSEALANTTVSPEGEASDADCVGLLEGGEVGGIAGGSSSFAILPDSTTTDAGGSAAQGDGTGKGNGLGEEGQHGTGLSPGTGEGDGSGTDSAGSWLSGLPSCT